MNVLRGITLLRTYRHNSHSLPFSPNSPHIQQGCGVISLWLMVDIFLFSLKQGRRIIMGYAIIQLVNLRVCRGILIWNPHHIAVWHLGNHSKLCITCDHENPPALDLLGPMVPQFLITVGLIPASSHPLSLVLS